MGSAIGSAMRRYEKTRYKYSQASSKASFYVLMGFAVVFVIGGIAALFFMWALALALFIFSAACVGFAFLNKWISKKQKKAYEKRKAQWENSN